MPNLSFHSILLALVLAPVFAFAFFWIKTMAGYSPLENTASENACKNVTSKRSLWKARPSVYSSFECTGGSQRYDGLVMIEKDGGRAIEPPFGHASTHMCIFRDVCMKGGALQYYVDPAVEDFTPQNLRASSLESGFYYQSLLDVLQQTPHFPRIVRGSIPSDLVSLPDDRLYVFDEFAFPATYSHVLLDEVMPAYSASEVLGINAADMQLVGVRTCDQLAYGSPDRCRENTARWLPKFFRHAYLPAPQKDACFRQILVGHHGMFSLTTQMYMHRASAIRAMRVDLLLAEGLPVNMDHPSEHFVLVLQKVAEISAVGYPGICADVTQWVARLSPAPKVECVTPKDMSIRDQLVALARATVTVSEHGSTSYASLFQTPGSSIVAVNADPPPQYTKEMKVLNFNIDVQAFYTTKVKIDAGEGPGTLLVALERAGTRFNLPQVHIVP
jgi:hypothetical protein